MEERARKRERMRGRTTSLGWLASTECMPTNSASMPPFRVPYRDRGSAAIAERMWSAPNVDSCLVICMCSGPFGTQGSEIGTTGAKLPWLDELRIYNQESVTGPRWRIKNDNTTLKTML
jgi:hypothetical protein